MEAKPTGVVDDSAAMIIIACELGRTDGATGAPPGLLGGSAEEEAAYNAGRHQGQAWRTGWLAAHPDAPPELAELAAEAWIASDTPVPNGVIPGDAVRGRFVAADGTPYFVDQWGVPHAVGPADPERRIGAARYRGWQDGAFGQPTAVLETSGERQAYALAYEVGVLWRASWKESNPAATAGDADAAADEWLALEWSFAVAAGEIADPFADAAALVVRGWGKDRKTMTQKTTQQQPTPDQRNAANAQTNGPQTATRPNTADGNPTAARPTLSGTAPTPCKDRKTMTQKTTQQQPAPDQWNAARAQTNDADRDPAHAHSDPVRS